MIFLGHQHFMTIWVKALEISQSNWCNGYPFMSRDPCRPHTGNTMEHVGMVIQQWWETYCVRVSEERWRHRRTSRQRLLTRTDCRPGRDGRPARDCRPSTDGRLGRGAWDHTFGTALPTQHSKERRPITRGWACPAGASIQCWPSRGCWPITGWLSWSFPQRFLAMIDFHAWPYTSARDSSDTSASSRQSRCLCWFGGHVIPVDTISSSIRCSSWTFITIMNLAQQKGETWDVTAGPAIVSSSRAFVRKSPSPPPSRYARDRTPGGRLNKKDGLTRYGDSHVKDKTS